MLGDGSQMIGKIKTFDLNKAPFRLLQKKMAFCFCACFVRWFFSGKIGIYGFVVLLMAITS